MKLQRSLPVTFLLLLFATDAVEARKPVSVPEEERIVVQVFDAPGSTADEVFRTSKVWIAENFRSGKAVIEYEDPASGTIIGNGSIAYPCDGGWTCRVRAESWRVKFTMKVEARDGRFRLTFSNVLMSYPPYNNMGVSRPGYDEPVASKADMDNIRAKLLAIGPEIVAGLKANHASGDW